MKALLLTLGHNSSAAFVEDGKVLRAYETERVTGAKSDSRFPEAVLRLDRFASFKPDVAYVTHWDPMGRLSNMSAKHWRPDLLSGVPIISLNPDLTHHDTHMMAAIAYAGQDFPKDGSIGVVVDGFGTHGEHFSVYRLDVGGPTLLTRFRGYDTSLGLWYQYATAFMGMKMHEDEYKLLGYEVHVSPGEAEKIDALAGEVALYWIHQMDTRSAYMSMYDPVFNIEALARTKELVYSKLSQVCDALGIIDPSSPRGRALLAYFVQKVLESVVLTIVGRYNPKNLLLSGGVFYNVKLNLQMLRSVEGLVCVYPLAGDQGNAFGLFSHYNPSFRMPDTLCLGHRTLANVGEVDGLYYAQTGVELAEFAHHHLTTTGRVNIVRGSMEFGPRALCNTSTLAIPTAEQVEAINRANDRNTVMPMAPVMTQAKFNEIFEPNARRVWKSCEHMIMAVEHVEHPSDAIVGISHKYTMPYVHHTSRPQIATDPWLVNLLNQFGGILINTSFNFHGRPIAFGMSSVIESHQLELCRDPKTRTGVLLNA